MIDLLKIVPKGMSDFCTTSGEHSCLFGFRGVEEICSNYFFSLLHKYLVSERFSFTYYLSLGTMPNELHSFVQSEHFLSVDSTLWLTRDTM